MAILVLSCVLSGSLLGMAVCRVLRRAGVEL